MTPDSADKVGLLSILLHDQDQLLVQPNGLSATSSCCGMMTGGGGGAGWAGPGLSYTTTAAAAAMGGGGMAGNVDHLMAVTGEPMVREGGREGGADDAAARWGCSS